MDYLVGLVSYFYVSFMNVFNVAPTSGKIGKKFCTGGFPIWSNILSRIWWSSVLRRFSPFYTAIDFHSEATFLKITLNEKLKRMIIIRLVISYHQIILEFQNETNENHFYLIENYKTKIILFKFPLKWMVLVKLAIKR